ncbi:MAG: hypothetical protein LJE59_09785 [Chromatiaceae bacterium]|jgi:hypothetical protein|nr:hypothetical protein [Chromatiaceae bacterium]
MMRVLAWALVLGLAALLGYQWHGWSAEAGVAAYLQPPPGEQQQPDAAVATSTLPSIEALGPLDDFMAVVERPLFNSDRRPREAALKQDETPTAEGRPDLQLSGIVAVKGTYQAHVRPPKGDVVKLALGDAYQGWQVSEILPDQLILTLDGRSEAFELRPFGVEEPAPTTRRRKARGLSLPRRFR